MAPYSLFFYRTTIVIPSNRISRYFVFRSDLRANKFRPKVAHTSTESDYSMLFTERMKKKSRKFIEKSILNTPALITIV